MDWCMGLRRWFSADKYGIQSGFQYNNSPTRSLCGPSLRDVRRDYAEDLHEVPDLTE